jgi:hypothetical protein
VSIIELSIESRSGEGNGKTLRQYNIGGENIVGAHGNEAFAVRIRNKQAGRIECKLSLDGTDVANGGEASADATGTRWVIDGYGSMLLSAWPERKDGGAAFVFGQASAAVAAHTHGNMSHQGVIAVAVFVEGAPVVHHEPWYGSSFTYDCMPVSYNANRGGNPNLERFGSAVGAGSQVEQHIATAAGLRRPKLAEIVRVRHVWWDDLRAMLDDQAITRDRRPFAGIPGFPATRQDPFRGVNLGSTPRAETMSRYV